MAARPDPDAVEATARDTGSADTTGQDVTVETAATTTGATAADTTTGDATTADSGTGDDGTVTGDPAETTTTGDDLRERYRQALARKQGHGSGTSSAGGAPGAAARPGGTGPAKAQRTFRRKSGG